MASWGDVLLQTWIIPGASQLQLAQPYPANQHRLRFSLSPHAAELCTRAGPTGPRHLTIRSFLVNSGKKRNHRWPLKSQLALNGVGLPHVQQPQSWDGLTSKDKDEDVPLALPVGLLRVGCAHVCRRDGLTPRRTGRSHPPPHPPPSAPPPHCASPTREGSTSC